MQPKMCSKCKKNIAVVFITKVENGVTMNEGYCLKCARSLGIPQIDQAVKQMGISDEDLDMLSDEMSSMFGQKDDSDSSDDDEIDSQTATFPLLNQLFGNTPAPQPRPSRKEEGEPKEKKKSKRHKFLDSYCMDLTGRAREGKLDKVIGRDVETERVIQILNRRQKNNPCLIGEPGVGKTAIAEGLAQRIAAGDVPYKLRDKEVFLLDLTALVAGTQFRGQFESRMKSLIGEIKECGNIILVIDEVHNLVGAGDAEGSMNAANILKPALSRGEIQVIGATTFAEYRKYIEKDAALERRFQPVTVAEPTIAEASLIMQGIAKSYAEFHGVEISPEIAHQCVVLSADVKRVGGQFRVFAKGGREDTGRDALEWIKWCVNNGAGEVCLNSIDTDGVRSGFDLEMLDAVAARVNVPIIASGGAGKKEDFLELFRHKGIDAGLAAGIFHQKLLTIRALKEYLNENGVEMRL